MAEDIKEDRQAQYEAMMAFADYLQKKGSHTRMGMDPNEEGFCATCRAPWNQCHKGEESYGNISD